MKLFLVDDSLIIRARLMSILTEFPGVEIVGQAGTAIDAERMINETLPDVVILDIKLPDGDGIEVLKNIKKKYPKMIVIMLTNYPYPQFQEEAILEGADFFFDKSTEFVKLFDIMNELGTSIK